MPLNTAPKRTVVLFESTRPYNPTAGGSIRSLRVVASALADDGWDVFIVSYINHPLLEFSCEENIQNIVLRHFGLRGIFSLFGSKKPKVRTKSKHENTLQVSVASRLKLYISIVSSPLFLLFNSLVIYRLQKTLSADLVYTNTGLKSDRSAIFASMLSDAKLICHLRNLPKLSLLDRLLARRADGLISISQTVHDHYKSQAIENQKSIILLNALGMEFERLSYITSRRALDDDDVVRFGCFSRLIHWKGLGTLLRAFRTYLDKGGQGVLSIFGEGPDYVSLRQDCYRLELEKNIVFHGHVDNVVDAYLSCDVVVAPSDTPEPLGRTVMEAKCLGAAVIASRGGGYLETVNHGVDGLLFNMGCSEDLADKMLQMYREKRLKSRLITAGLKQSKQWSVSNYSRNLTTFVNGVVA